VLRDSCAADERDSTPCLAGGGEDIPTRGDEDTKATAEEDKAVTGGNASD
jgi:hypothetical protein